MTRLKALVEALAEFNITGNISGFLDEGVQGFFSFQRGNQTITDSLVKTTKVVACDPGIGVIGFVSELENKHLEFGGIFVRSSLSSLADGFSAFNDIGLTVGRQVMVFEGLDELLERRERFDVLIRVDVPHFCGTAEHSTSKTGLFVFGNLSEFHVFFYAEGPSCDGGDGCVRPVEFIGSGDLDRFRHSQRLLRFGGRVGFGLRF